MGKKRYGSKAEYDRLLKAALASGWIGADLRKRGWEALAAEAFGRERVEQARTALRAAGGREDAEDFEGAGFSYRIVTRPGVRLPGDPTVHEPPLAPGEVVEAELTFDTAEGTRTITRRVRLPIPDLPPVARCTLPDSRRLDDPLGRLVADLAFGPEGLEAARREADGREPEYVEFSVVTAPGQPADVDLDSPLAAGEVIDTFLLVRAADADTAGWRDESGPQVELGEVECDRIAHRRFPRKVLPEAEVERFLDEATEEVSSERDAAAARRTIVFEEVVGPG
jgi:hypothetical protein